MGERILEHFHWPQDGAAYVNVGLSEALVEQARLSGFIGDKFVAWRRYPEWLHERSYEFDCQMSVFAARGVFCETEAERAEIQEALDNPDRFLVYESLAQNHAQRIL